MVRNETEISKKIVSYLIPLKHEQSAQEAIFSQTYIRC